MNRATTAILNYINADPVLATAARTRGTAVWVQYPGAGDRDRDAREIALASDIMRTVGHRVDGEPQPAALIVALGRVAWQEIDWCAIAASLLAEVTP